jgi:caa(3)-type oxidase subunit IV
MTAEAAIHEHFEEHVHPGASVYVTVAAFLVVLTAMEITVFYVSALASVMIPLLIILSVAKFALVAMFYMHLRYDSYVLTSIFMFALAIAALLLIALLLLFAYLSHYLWFMVPLARILLPGH